MTIRERARAQLDGPRGLWWAVGIGLLLVAPALGTGLVMDDLVHRVMVSPDAPSHLERAPHDLYRFFLDSDAWRESARAAGLLPWYADPQTRVEHWRPLASLTLAADHRFWPGFPVVAHAQSLLYYGILVFLLGLLYRRLLGAAWLGAFAALLFAVDDAHGQTVAWLSSRHALLAMVFGAAALLAHVRWRDEAWKPGALLAPVLLALGLFSGESALAVTGYLFAYALLLDKGSALGRIVSLVPCALVSLAWRITYVATGHGSAGTDFYRDPIEEPLAFLAALPQRLPVLLGAQLTPIWADLAAIFTGERGLILLLVFTGFLLPIAATLWPWIRKDRLAAFWAVGMAVAALPLCVPVPMDRHLLPIGIGGMGLMAQLIAKRSDVALGAYWKGWPVRILVGFMIAFHLVLAPLMMPLRAYQIRMMQSAYDGAYASLDRVGELEGRTLVIVRGPDWMWTGYGRHARRLAGRPAPERVWALATGLEGGRVTRIDERTLGLECGEGFMSSIMDLSFRHHARPFRPGDRATMGEVTVVVAAVSDEGRPTELVASFPEPLEVPTLAWATWTAEGYVPFMLPEVGESVEIEAIPFADMASFSYDPEGE